MPKKVKKKVTTMKKTVAAKKGVKKAVKKMVKKAVKKTAKKVAPKRAIKSTSKSVKKKASVKKIEKKSQKLSKKTKTIKKTKKAKKTEKVTAVQKGYHSITPYLIVHNAPEAIEFYKNAFGAEEVMRIEKEGGKVGYAELEIGGSKIMLSDAHPSCHALSAQDIGATPVAIHLYIDDVDTVVEKAIAMGAELLRDVETMYYGDRSGGVKDPFGHQWYISTHVENVTEEEIKNRLEKLAQITEEATV